MELTNQQLYEIQGGGINELGTFINSITKIITTIAKRIPIIVSDSEITKAKLKIKLGGIKII